MFSDSVDETLEQVRELLSGIPAPSRERAKQAAVKIENTVMALQRDNPRDPAVALGAAFAIFMIAQRIVETDRSAQQSGGSLIQLLS